MTLATSNPTMDISSVTQTAVSDSKSEAEKELDKKLIVMRELKTNMELNAWKIGKLVNEIRDGKLWREAGYTSADHCFNRKFKEIGRPRTLYRFGDIARRFTDDDVRRFGTTKLEAILTHERQTGQQLPLEIAHEQEISLTQKDGSGVVKKLKDCSSYELIRSNTHRRQSAHAEAIKAQTTKPGMLRKVVEAGVGVVMLVVADLLPPTWLSAVLTLLGATTLLAGGYPLVRRGYHWLVEFIQSGRAVELLAATPSKLLALGRNVVHGARWLWSFIRTGQIIGAVARLPSKLSSLARKVVASLRKLAALFRAKQAIHVLAKLPSKLPGLRRRRDQVRSEKSQTQPPLTGGMSRRSAS